MSTANAPPVVDAVATPASGAPPSPGASRSLDETLQALGVDPTLGLALGDVGARREQHGFNEVPLTAAHPVREFLGKFAGISAWMLELIMLLSAVLGNYSDLAVVGALLIINALVGFLQERRAAGVVEALRRRVQIRARVLRDSAWSIIPARELVPGDIMRLRSGDIVPADIRCLVGNASIDQSALTGESQDAEKAQGDVLPSGSVVRRGECTGVVTLTGSATSLGRTTELVQQARPALHIETVVDGVVRWLFLIVGCLLGVVIVLSILRGASLREMVPLMLVLLMSAVPIALPVMFSISLAIGARRLAGRGVLVTRQSAVEDAATMDVLCADKTGTITMNQLAITEVIPLGAASEDEVLATGALASQEANQDPIDSAFLTAARERRSFARRPASTPISFTPFDAASRRTEALVEEGGQRMRVMKGALRTIAEACALSPSDIAGLEKRVDASAAKGYRTLAVARGTPTGTPLLVGLVSLFDPPRPEAARLVAALRDRGVAMKMLTGDALAVASEIARGVGLTTMRAMAELKGGHGPAGSSDLEMLDRADGFAEMFPEDKFTIVQHLQGAGHVTGMTGDGVNDAPALRQAEVGIAVSSATDVAKSAASVVLTDPGLTNIVALIEEGRTVYQCILTWIINKISRTILKSSFVAIAYVITGTFVITAFAMLLLTFMSDFHSIALATDRVRHSKRPETWKIGGFIAVSAALGLAMTAESLAGLLVAWERFSLSSDHHALSTFSFLLLLYFAVFSLVSVRERRAFWSSRPSTLLLVALAVDALLGTLLTRAGLPGLTPLPWSQTMAIAGYALVSCLVINDAIKVAMIRWCVPTAVADPLRA
jgi:H+-transporting ATPase